MSHGSTLTSKLGSLRARLEQMRVRTQTRITESKNSVVTSEGWRDYLADLSRTRQEMAEIPRTQRIADAAVQQWDYQGDIGADFIAIEDNIRIVGRWIVAQAGELWTGYGIEEQSATDPFSGVTYETWAENIPTFTSAQTSDFHHNVTGNGTALLAALNTFLDNIRA